MSQEKTLFPTLLNDHSASQAEHPLGCRRFEPDNKEPGVLDPGLVHANMTGFLYRERVFRYVQNISGGALVKDAAVMADDLIVATVTATTNTAANTIVRSTGSFISDGVKRGDLVYVLDDAGAAGAAPEGEMGVVKTVAALTLTVEAAFTAAVTASDTVNFIRPWTIKAAAAAGAGQGRIAGIPMSDIANGEFGWIQTRGIYPNANVVAAGTAVTTGAPLYLGTALLTPTAPVLTTATPDALTAGTWYAPVAEAIHAVTSDTVRRKAMVFLKCE